MADFVPANNVDSNSTFAASLGNGDYFYILSNITMVGRGDAAIFATGVNNYGYIAGSLFGSSIALDIAVPYSGYPQGNATTIDVGTTGEVVGMATNAMVVSCSNFTLNNAGRIACVNPLTGLDNFAIELQGDGAGQSTINNSGLIEGRDVGVSHGGTEKFVLNNSGTIRGGVFSFNSDDVVTNSGLIVGDVHLSGGSDIYDGRDGRLSGGDVDGGAGNDSLMGGSGAEILSGGEDSDKVQGGGGNDTLDGGNGIDRVDYSDKTRGIVVTLNGATAVTVTVGGVAEDSIYNFEYVTGGSAADKITGDTLNNDFWGGGGNDTLNGGDGRDTIRGGTGADSMDGGTGVDALDYQDKTTGVVVTLTGSTWATVKIGGKAEDHVRNFEEFVGGSGDDKVAGDKLDNFFIGNNGNDSLSGGGGNDTLQGNEGADTLLGGDGNDSLDAGNGANSINGGDGTDLIKGNGTGKDTIDGGSGKDTIDYTGRGAIEVTLHGSSSASVKIAGIVEDSVKNIETLLTGSGLDKLTGDSADNFFSSGSGSDTLIGGGGNDTLIGGAGQDSMTGGTGTDHFRFAYLGDFSAADIITDFVHGTDRIEITNSGKATPQTIDPSLFSSVVNSNTGDPTDLFVYDRASGILWFDSQPGFAGGEAPLAVLLNKPQDFSAADIWWLA